MRILYPIRIDSFFAQAGQSVVERAVLAEVLAQGVAVRLVSFGEAEAQERLARDIGAQYRHLPLEIVDADAATSSAVLADVDALMLHSLPLDDVWAWLERVRPMAAVPTVQYVHSLLLARFEQVMWGQLWSRWDGRPPARLVVPSECTAGRARTLAPEAKARGGRLPPVTVIPHGVDAPAVRGGDRARARARLGIDEPALVLLSVGRITPEKAAYTQLVLAFHDTLRLRSVDRPLVLVLAGSVSEHDKPYVALLARYARRLGIDGSVRVVENFDEGEKASLYAAGDVFVSLANDPQESFGVALLEAMAAGLPVLATRWDGYPEALPAVYESRMVPTVASHALARALDWTSGGEACAPAFDAASAHLARLVADHELRATLGSEGSRFAEAHSWTRSVGSLVGLLEQLAAEGRTAGDAARDGALAPARSMVDGLASTYLEDDPPLRLGSPSPSRGRRRQALWIAARPIPPAPPYSPDHGRPGWMSAEPTRGRRDVLRAAAAAGRAGLPASHLRACTGLADAEADLLLLRLIRYGLLDVVTQSARRFSGAS